jgi:SAM-dependent MidA family methyltransferase
VSEEVSTRLREAIEARGPIPFSEFMEIALYSAGGFYDRPPVGEEGHFVTSPHAHPVFGSLVANGLRSMWERMDRPDRFRVIELGAGDGTLAMHLLPALHDIPVEYVAVERSEGAREELAAHPLTFTIAPSLEVLEQRVTGVVLANELLDNLPFRLLRGTEKGVREIRIGLHRGRFVEVESQRDDELLQEELLDLELPIGQEAAVSLEALNLIDRLARMLVRGFALFIDYAARIGHPSGRVHGYRRHRVVDDILAAPGSSDITAGVDFAMLARRAAAFGLETFGPVSQRSALLALGYEDWQERERLRQTDALGARAGRDALGAWDSRNRARMLVDRDGLGALRWFSIATPGLGWPEWLADAYRRDQ